MAFRPLLSILRVRANAALLMPATLMFVISAYTVYYWYAFRQDTTSQFTIEPSFHDFGQVQQGQRLKTDLVFRNRTGKILELSNGQGSCDCFVLGQAQRQRMAPGSSLMFPIMWDVSGRRGATFADLIFEYHVLDQMPVARADSIQYVTFRATAYVQPEYHVTPATLKFARHARDKELLHITQNAVSTTGIESQIRLVDFGANHEAISVKRVKEPSDKIGTLLVVFDPTLWNIAAGDSLLDVKLDLIVSSKYEPRFSVPIVIENILPQHR